MELTIDNNTHGGGGLIGRSHVRVFTHLDHQTNRYPNALARVAASLCRQDGPIKEERSVERADTVRAAIPCWGGAGRVGGARGGGGGWYARNAHEDEKQCAYVQTPLKAQQTQ